MKDVPALEARIVALEDENARLRQQIIVAAQWCNDKCCEFKHLRVNAPSVDEFTDNFAKWIA